MMKQKQYRYEERGSKTIRRKGIHLKLLTQEEYTKLQKRRIVGITRLKKPKRMPIFYCLFMRSNSAGRKPAGREGLNPALDTSVSAIIGYFKVIRPKKVLVSLAAIVTAILLLGLIFFCPLKNDESTPSDEVLPTEEEEGTNTTGRRSSVKR
jgi:hypothetical protein